MCFGCSKKPFYLEGSNEYQQHMFWFKNNKNNFQLHNRVWIRGIVFFPLECENLADLDF